MPAPESPSVDLTKTISTRIRAGLTPEKAALSQGVPEETFQKWMEIGKQGGKGTAVYIKFREAVAEAEAEFELLLVGHIYKSAKDGVWQAAAWLAERRFPSRYLRKSVNSGDIEKANPGEPTQGDPFSGLDNVTPIKTKRDSK